jgi:hypothetical protein
METHDSMATDERGGLLIPATMAIRIRNLRLSLDPDASPPPITVEVVVYMSPIWLEIALSHLKEAERHHAALLGAADHSPARNEAMVGEFLASMQAIVAGATALEALYSSLEPHVKLPKPKPDTSRNRYSSRI